MASYEVGDFIRNQRIARHLTQEQLSEGICSPVTLSRIENGVQAPSKNQIEHIMQKLGLSATKFFNVFLSLNEYSSFMKKEELIDCIREDDLENAKRIIDELDNDKEFQKSLSLPFLLREKASIMLREERDFPEALDLVTKSIKMTMPDFDENRIASYLLTYDEILTINLMAILYWKLDNIDKAIEILYALRACINSIYVDELEKSRTYPTIIYNLTKFLGLSERYKEAIPLCDEGVTICIRNNKLELLPHLIFNKACDLCEIGNTDPCKELFTQAYYALKIGGKYKEAEMAKNHAKTAYNIIIT